MKKHVAQLEKRLDTDIDYLKKVYRFTFTFLLEEGQKTLRMYYPFSTPLHILTGITALETATAYWKLLLEPLYGDKIEIWCNFLEREWKQAISKDTWNMFFVFLQDWDKDPQLKEYDEEAAWPSLIDAFVESFHDINS
jgi:DCN1-like protein 1/2